MDYKTGFVKRWTEHTQKQSFFFGESAPSAYHSDDSTLRFRMEALQDRLVEQYQGEQLEDILPGASIRTPEGNFYQIRTCHPLSSPPSEKNRTIHRLLSHLRMIPGLGPHHENQLHHQHIFTFDSIPTDSRFFKAAQVYIEQIQEGPYDQLYWNLYHALGRSHQDMLQLSHLIDISHFVFLDIETLGLGSQPISVIGAGRIVDNTLCISQYFAREVTEEAAILYAFQETIHPQDFFVTFNGEYFDLPFIRNRMRYMGIKGNLSNPNFDALFFSRKVWKDLPNCKLQTIEKEIFHIDRIDDVPGAYCPGFYQQYCQTKNIGTVVPILHHNQQDIYSLAKIFFRLQQIWK